MTVNYDQYLRSNRWKEVREYFLMWWGRRCVICNRETSTDNPLEVHHRTYENLGHEALTDCIVLCRECHSLHHNFSGNFLAGVYREVNNGE
jgi:5-methylcytosine-specific restriction endonuclease McrA